MAIIRRSKREQSRLLVALIAAFLIRYLRPYQLRWVRDRSRLKAGVMSRQIGKSEVIVLEAVLESFEPPREPEQTTILVSSSGTQAELLLRKATRWCDIFDQMARKGLGFSLYADPPTTERIRLWNGVQIVSIPANPRTAAGYTGPVYWDEAGRTPRDYEMWEALKPITDAGPFNFRMTGTPWGDSGIFWETLLGEKGAGRPGWSRHKVTLPQAISLGLTRDIADIRSQFDPQTFAQDYLCEFVSDQSAAFPRDLLMAALNLDVPEVPMLEFGTFPRALGVDIGRLHDRTALAEAAEFPAGIMQVHRTELWPQKRFDAQIEGISQWIRERKITACNVDATGIGMPLAEELVNRHPAIVQPVTFTAQLKHDLVTHALALLMDRRLKIVSENDLLSDLASIRKIQGSGGSVRYDAPRTERGHADLAWAAMMALSRLQAQTDWNISVHWDIGQPVLEELMVDAPKSDKVRIVGRSPEEEHREQARHEPGRQRLPGLESLVGHSVLSEAEAKALSRAGLADMFGLKS